MRRRLSAPRRSPEQRERAVRPLDDGVCVAEPFRSEVLHHRLVDADLERDARAELAHPAGRDDARPGRRDRHRQRHRQLADEVRLRVQDLVRGDRRVLRPDQLRTTRIPVGERGVACGSRCWQLSPPAHSAQSLDGTGDRGHVGPRRAACWAPPALPHSARRFLHRPSARPSTHGTRDRRTHPGGNIAEARYAAGDHSGVRGGSALPRMAARGNTSARCER